MQVRDSNRMSCKESDYNIEILPKNATKHPFAKCSDFARQNCYSLIFCCLKIEMATNISDNFKYFVKAISLQIS